MLIIIEKMQQQQTRQKFRDRDFVKFSRTKLIFSAVSKLS